MVQEREKDILAAIAADLSKVSVRGVGGTGRVPLFPCYSKLFCFSSSEEAAELLRTPALLRALNVVFALTLKCLLYLVLAVSLLRRLFIGLPISTAFIVSFLTMCP